MPGSGKSEASNILREMGVNVISMGDIVRQSYEKYKKNNESIIEFALRIRKEKGKSIIAELTLESLDRKEMKNPIAIEGIRCMEEVEVFKRSFKEGVVLVSIHAPPSVRYKRILGRLREDDPKILNEIIARDYRELDLGIGSVIAMSDFIVINDKDLESFKKNCRELFEMIINGKSNSKSRT